MQRLFIVNFLSQSLADDKALSKRLVPSEEESKSLPAAEDVSSSAATSSSTHVYVFHPVHEGYHSYNNKSCKGLLVSEIFPLLLYRESVQACALCNCVERSLHGQRELRYFGPSSEWLTLKPSASPLPQPGNDDLSSIGFSSSPCLAALFDDSG